MYFDGAGFRALMKSRLGEVRANDKTTTTTTTVPTSHSSKKSRQAKHGHNDRPQKQSTLLSFNVSDAHTSMSGTERMSQL
jgi:hypothetical protein